MWINAISTALESDTLSLTQRRVFELLLEALNDWPQNPSSLDDFLLAVENQIRGEVTLSNVQKALNKLDLSTEAWIGESLMSLKEIMDLHSGRPLREILNELPPLN
jgi:hypothetical protein